jgi:hypothetical protein
VPAKEITLNPKQREFVNTPLRYSGYFGGIGAGKTFSGILRGLQLSQQKKPEGALYGPRGMITATNYPNLMDAVLPQFFEIVEGTDLLIRYEVQRKIAHLKNDAQIYFRSLDDPNNIRGVELAWFFIDEGRNVDRRSWDILIGRLRQKGYDHKGWVCSTPNGWDWMWQLFHEDSPDKLPQAQWYGAPTDLNRDNLPEGYVEDLALSYHGDWYRQEVLGEFVGLMAGAVFPHWVPSKYAVEVNYDPELPLYSFWDFGIGDLQVVLFAQVAHIPIQMPDLSIRWQKELRFIDLLEAKNRTAAQWAQEWHNWLDRNTAGRRPNLNIGDPAGKQRAHTGTSVMDDLAAAGVVVVPAPKKPQDYAIRILDNMMAGDLVKVDKDNCSRLSAAFATHHWKTDDNGNRTGTTAIHDWTSHFCDAARYGATLLFGYNQEVTGPPEREPYNAAQYGWVEQQLDSLANKEDHWIGEGDEEPVLFSPLVLGRN